MKENEEAKEAKEMIADIIAEYRADADKMDCGGLYQPTTIYVRQLLNRIEAALEREREASEDETIVKSCNTCKHFMRKRKWCRVHDYSPHDPSTLPLVWPNGPCPQWECKYV